MRHALRSVGGMACSPLRFPLPPPRCRRTSLPRPRRRHWSRRSKRPGPIRTASTRGAARCSTGRSGPPATPRLPPATPPPRSRPSAQAATLARSLVPAAAGPEVLVFASLALPEASWRRWSLDAARVGAAFVLRGVAPDGLAATVRRIRARLPEGGAGVAIDPALFRRFAVDAAPAVVVVPGGAAPCRRRGCADAPAPAHDRIAGNIGLVAALEAVAAEGAVGRETARRTLARLQETRP